MSPKVTVLVPVFNREAFVDAAIESVLAQDFADIELLLVDDGSTDRTPEILRAWALRDSRVVVVTSPVNLGIPVALNLGLAHARAPYVARLDSDDVMMPGRLQAQADVLDTEPEVVLVSSSYEFMDVDGNYLGTWKGDEPHEVVAYLLNFFNIIGGHGQVMYRRADVLAEGGYSLKYPASEDYDLWVRLLRRGRIFSLPLVGMRQRQHGAQSKTLFGQFKRANWLGIMGRSLTDYLMRPIAEKEISALITLWRLDGTLGMSASADATMREAFARFCRDNPDARLRKLAAARTAQQWQHAAQMFLDTGQPAEARLYIEHSAWWSAQASSHAPAKLPRTIWMLWMQGRAAAPFLVSRCIESWQRENPDWNVVILDKDNLSEHTTLDLTHAKLAALSATKQSNLIRLHVLARHGGVWADATTLCMRPLNDWIDANACSGFFAYSRPAPDRLLSTWFLASQPQCPLVEKLEESYAAFFLKNTFPAPGTARLWIVERLGKLLNTRTSTTRLWFSPVVTKFFRVYPYFIFHYLFERLIATDARCRAIWAQTPEVSADAPHHIQAIGFSAPLDDDTKREIDERKTAVYKLTWRYDHSACGPTSVLAYLLEGRHDAQLAATSTTKIAAGVGCDP